MNLDPKVTVVTRLTLKTALSPETLAKLSQIGKPQANASSSKPQKEPLKKSKASKPKASPPPAPKKASRTPKEGSSLEKEEKKKARKNFLAAKKWVETSFPKAFNFKEPLPLKIGIRQDLLTLESPLTRRQRSKVLSAYLHRPKYLEAVATGAFRYDLKGDPVEEISEEHKEHARAQLALKKEARTKGAPLSS